MYSHHAPIHHYNRITRRVQFAENSRGLDFLSRILFSVELFSFFAITAISSNFCVEGLNLSTVHSVWSACATIRECRSVAASASVSNARRRPCRAAPRAALGSLYRFVAPLRTCGCRPQSATSSVVPFRFLAPFRIGHATACPLAVSAVARRHSRATGANSERVTQRRVFPAIRFTGRLLCPLCQRQAASCTRTAGHRPAVQAGSGHAPSRSRRACRQTKSIRVLGSFALRLGGEIYRRVKAPLALLQFARAFVQAGFAPFPKVPNRSFGCFCFALCRSGSWPRFDSALVPFLSAPRAARRARRTRSASWRTQRSWAPSRRPQARARRRLRPAAVRRTAWCF
jgi:hypothetical protein